MQADQDICHKTNYLHINRLSKTSLQKLSGFDTQYVRLRTEKPSLWGGPQKHVDIPFALLTSDHDMSGRCRDSF